MLISEMPNLMLFIYVMAVLRTVHSDNTYHLYHLAERVATVRSPAHPSSHILSLVMNPKLPQTFLLL